MTYQDAACSKDVESDSRVDTSEAFSNRPVSGTHPRVGAEQRASTSPSAGSPGDYTTYRGAWRSPLQFELSLNGVRDGDVPTISPVVLEVRADGEVAGTGIGEWLPVLWVGHSKRCPVHGQLGRH